MLQVTNIAIIILNYSCFEVKLAYFLLHRETHIFITPFFYVVLLTGTLATVRFIYIYILCF